MEMRVVLDLLTVSNETLPLGNMIKGGKHPCTFLAGSQFPRICISALSCSNHYAMGHSRTDLLPGLSSTAITSGRIIYRKLLSELRGERTILKYWLIREYSN